MSKRDLLSFPIPYTYISFSVTNSNESCKGKVPPPFNYFCYPIYMDNPLLVYCLFISIILRSCKAGGSAHAFAKGWRERSVRCEPYR